jgi:hypothetical protein
MGRLWIDLNSCKNRILSNGGYLGFVNSGSREANLKVGAMLPSLYTLANVS